MSAALLTVVVATFALGESSDYYIYTQYYDSVYYYGYQTFSQVEPGFNVLLGLASSANLSLTAIYATLCFFSVFTKTYVLRSIGRAVTPIALYMLFMFPLHEYTQIRTAVAISITYVAISLYERRPLLAIGTIALAPFIHYSSAIVIVFGALAILLQVHRRPYLIPAIALSIPAARQFVGVFFTVLSGTNMSNYEIARTQADPSILSYSNAIFIMCLALIFILLANLKQYNGNFPLSLATLLCSAALPMAFVFYEYPAVSYRLKELLFSYLPLAIAHILRKPLLGWMRALLAGLSLLFGLATFYTYAKTGVIAL